ncbi:MAG: RagB/SusD family nutrient uptake outer membrane protein [Tannerella sp.]|nr:RagB/SusD family nutrient uptake outer membrane protein [Tannerella sp.]
MKYSKIILLWGLCIFLLSGCEDLIEPANQLMKNENMDNDPNYATGFLLNAYRGLPGYYATGHGNYSSDDAVTNDLGSDFVRAATGSWTSTTNPFSQWNNTYGSILHINLFLEHVDNVKFVTDKEADDLIRMRSKGEAYGLRAYHMYFLLRTHAGYTPDGKLMGVPIITASQNINTDFNQPRAIFDECIQQIYSDLDKAEEYLPWEYNDLTRDEDIPEKFRSVTTKYTMYNRAMGKNSREYFNALIASAVRSKVSLLAASEAFQSPADQTKWELAANNAARVIDYGGGISKLAASNRGHLFYDNTDNTAEGTNPPEMIWREYIVTDNSDLERDNFPPSLFGSGRMNPTQNLVDAFPMANGYPITDQINSGYNSSDPYSGRDPRLAYYIIYNGSRAGVNNTQIFTGSQSGTDDGINVRETSTRTGYYMKKLLRMDVNRNPAAIQHQPRYTPRIRYTEIFLNYAEAANEAWGPTGTNGNTYSAYDVIKAIRTRAGVGTNNGDPYLESCKSDKNKMRDLIRNERRLELCFEGFRFWDMRRWKLNLNETARGMNVNQSTYTPIDVEIRSFQDYMYYGPIPYSETLKFNNLEQNKGW